MFKTVREQLPEFISERFQNTNTISRYNLRDSELNLSIARPNSEALKKSFHDRVPLPGTVYLARLNRPLVKAIFLRYLITLIINSIFLISN